MKKIQSPRTEKPQCLTFNKNVLVMQKKQKDINDGWGEKSIKTNPGGDDSISRKLEL